MSTLVLHLDDHLASDLAALAAHSSKPLPDWVAEQLRRLVTPRDESEAYSTAWKAAFGSIADPSFVAPERAAVSVVEALDAR
jgi:hypothetical protein